MGTRSILDFPGASADGVTNNDGAIALAVASGDNIYIPAGNYVYKKSFMIPAGVTWEGDGYASNLIASGRDDITHDSGAIILTGEGSRLVNLRRTYTADPSRTDWEKGHAVLVLFASNFEVSGCFLYGATSAGLLIRASERGNVTGNVVKDTSADGIHITGESTNHFSKHIDVSGNQVSDVGDDCIAVVSYVNHGEEAVNRYITIRGNHTSGGLARGVTVIGGSHVTIAGNVIVSPKYAGVLIDSEASFDTHGGTGISVENNTLVKTGSTGAVSYGSIQVGGRATQRFADLMIKNNRLHECRGSAIVLAASGSGDVAQVQITGNYVSSAGANGLISAGVEDLRIENNDFRSVVDYGVVTEGGNGFLKVNGNVFTDVNKGKRAWVDVIQVRSGDFYKNIEVRNNLHRDPNNNGVERLVECFYNNVIAENNLGGAVTIGVLPAADDRQRVKAFAQPNSSAGDVPTLTADLNALLQRLREAGLIDN